MSSIPVLFDPSNAYTVSLHFNTGEYLWGPRISSLRCGSPIGHDVSWCIRKTTRPHHKYRHVGTFSVRAHLRLMLWSPWHPKLECPDYLNVDIVRKNSYYIFKTSRMMALVDYYYGRAMLLRESINIYLR